MIKAIIFDLGGVLFKNIWQNAGEEFSRLYGTSLEEFHRVRKIYWMQNKLGKINEDQLWEGMNKEFGRSLDKVELAKKLREYLIPVPEVKEFIAKLKGKYKLIILTNNSDELVADIKEKFGLEIFDHVISSSEVGLKKPDKEIYEWTLNKFQLKPEECIFIDDKERNIKPAEELGINTILFRSLEHMKEKLKEKGITW